MDTREINRLVERQSRHSRWNTAPYRLHSVYGVMSQGMERQCASAGSRHHSRVNAARTVLVFLLLLTAPLSIKALTRDYPYRYVAQNDVEVSVGVIEGLDILFYKV